MRLWQFSLGLNQAGKWPEGGIWLGEGETWPIYAFGVA